VAIIPSALRTHRYTLRIVVVTYRGKPLGESLTMLSDSRRLLPSYATAFCQMLGKHLQEVCPLTGPGASASDATRKGTTYSQSLDQLIRLK